MNFLRRRAFVRLLKGMVDHMQVLSIGTFEPCLKRYPEVMRRIEPSEWDYYTQAAAFYLGVHLAKAKAEAVGVSVDNVLITVFRSLTAWFSEIEAAREDMGGSPRAKLRRAMYTGEAYGAGIEGFQSTLEDFGDYFIEATEDGEGDLNEFAVVVGEWIVEKTAPSLDQLSVEHYQSIGMIVVRGMLEYWDQAP